MLLAPVLFYSAAAVGLTHVPSRPLFNPTVPPRTGVVRAATRDSPLMDDDLMDGFGGCVSGEPLGWKGAALATLGTYLWYLGTNTQTNKAREAVEGPGVRRRNILLVVLLQVGAANFRSGTARVCTDEERKELVIRKLERKGFDKDKVRHVRLWNLRTWPSLAPHRRTERRTRQGGHITHAWMPLHTRHYGIRLTSIAFDPARSAAHLLKCA